jgi:glycosyltransferase involved in cell wall biosynthesis
VFKRYALRHADVITANSSATEQAVRAIEPISTAVVRIPMGVSTDVPEKNDARVRELRSQFRMNRGVLVSFAGRLVEDKGLSDLLAAMVMLRCKFQDLTVLIIGDGPDREALERRVRDMGLSDQVYFTGWVAPEFVPCYLAAADVFVAPSWLEGQGLTVLEAMASGTPVVATSVGGMVDSVIHEQTGLLVEQRSPEQIAAAVERLIVEPELGERLKTRARAYVQERFCREASAKEFSKLFLDLTANRLG